MSFQAIYVLWLREMKGMWRAKSRVVGSLGMPIFFLIFLGLGLEHASMPGLPAGVDYVAFLTPWIIGMTLLGFKIRGLIQVMLAIVFMCLISFTFIGLGLIFASRMRDMQGFTLIVNFVMFPTFLLSGAIFPVQDLPSWHVPVCYANQLTYGVDGLRGVLLGAEASGLPILLDFVLITAFSIGMVGIGSYLFRSTEVER